MLAVVAVAGLGGAAAGCSQDERFLPPGQFSGSTADERPFEVLVADDPKINGREAEWDGRGRIKQTKGSERAVAECVTQAEGEELQCEVRLHDGRVETVELMRE